MLKEAAEKLNGRNDKRSKLGQYLYDHLMYDGEIYTTNTEMESCDYSLMFWNKKPLEWNNSGLVKRKSNPHSWHQSGIDFDELVKFLKVIGMGPKESNIDYSSVVVCWK